jgi:hypothetical protein
MNGFERHGIDHLSASSINLWTNAPDVWVMQYLHGKRTPMGPAAWRGICIEDALVQVKLGKMSLTEAYDYAEKKFDQRYMFGDQDSTRERANLRPMLAEADLALTEFGKPEFPEEGQEMVSITARGDGWSIPVIGYLDLVFPQYGVVIDLKTTTRIPSVMSPEHQLQRAIYQKAKGNMAVRFLYVSGKKHAILEDGDPGEILAQAKVQIGRMEAFLRHTDKDTAKQIVPVNPGSFYWRGAEDLRKEFYGV